MVYLLHFDRKYKHAGHYLGSADDVPERIARHRSGHGARLLQVIGEAGIDFQIVRTWKGGRKLERRLKRYKKSTALCPVCKALKCRSSENN